jgi:hypothetical protein
VPYILQDDRGLEPPRDGFEPSPLFVNNMGSETAYFLTQAKGEEQ